MTTGLGPLEGCRAGAAMKDNGRKTLGLVLFLALAVLASLLVVKLSTGAEAGRVAPPAKNIVFYYEVVNGRIVFSPRQPPVLYVGLSEESDFRLPNLEGWMVCDAFAEHRRVLPERSGGVALINRLVLKCNDAYFYVESIGFRSE